MSGRGNNQESDVQEHEHDDDESEGLSGLSRDKSLDEPAAYTKARSQNNGGNSTEAALRSGTTDGGVLTIPVPAAASGLEPLSREERDRVNGLVRNLGSESYATREAAQRDLGRFGLRALAEIFTAATESTDPEVRSRAGRLLNSA